MATIKFLRLKRRMRWQRDRKKQRERESVRDDNGGRSRRVHNINKNNDEK